MDLSGYDLVISSSGNGEAKGVRVKPGTTHICYCHAPTHFYWRHYNQYLSRPGFGIFDPLARLGLRGLVGPLRRWDLKAAKRPDAFIANSSHTQAEIKQFYGRPSVVVHPPVDIERFNVPATTRSGFVTAGRQTSYKQTDIIIEACNRLQLPLKVIGRGPEHTRLVGLAGPTIEFLTGVSDEAMAQHMASASAFLFAAFEDFGVTPVEAMAAGTPVIAYRAGGALDYVVPGQTGMFYDEQTAESLMTALKQFNPADYSSDDIKQVAAGFSSDRFQQNMAKLLKDVLQ